MLKISLDTNAVLDLCYRFYPEAIFTNLWSYLLIQMQQHQISFYLSSTNKDECLAKITDFIFDKNIFDEFINKLKVQVVARDDFGDSVIHIQKILRQHAHFAKSAHATKDQEDVDMIALARHIQGAALTSERGFGKASYEHRPQPRPKIPDICEVTNINCIDWVSFFKQLGMQFN